MVRKFLKYLFLKLKLSFSPYAHKFVTIIMFLHYIINGGPIAIQHFQTLLNYAIEYIESTTAEEFNAAPASILYKGHLKNKNLASSYRTSLPDRSLPNAWTYASGRYLSQSGLKHKPRHSSLVQA